MDYLAHIRKKDGAIQSLSDHLTGVAEKSKKFAAKIGLANQGELLGLLHDLGKYSDEFQRYLKSAGEMINPDEDDYIDAHGMKGKIDHSTAGAQYLFQRLPERQQENRNEMRLCAQILSLCIASHHSGLIDCISPTAKDLYTARMEKSDKKTHYTDTLSKIDGDIRDRLAALLSYPETIEVLTKIMKEVHDPEEKSPITTLFKHGLLVRFLFSCLIDADRIDTADFEEPHLPALRNNGKYRSWDELILRLENKLDTFKRVSIVDVHRQRISDACRNSAIKPPGIYLLTVPTGGGKTFASLRFALHHAKEHKLDRIIYVIPYTSIIDQNAEEVRKFIEDRDVNGAYLNRVVLEHHSNLTPEEESWQQKILAQDWDAPIVFTTSVQVLEALFGSGTRCARRMHQMARSVLIFDEVQTMPLRCIHMFNNAMNFLVRNCGSTVVLCTATQPLLNTVDRNQGTLNITPEQEIMFDVDQLFADLKRVAINDKRKAGGWSSDEVADLAVNELAIAGSVLAIVNTKKAAFELYKKCRLRTEAESYHLSTNMCPTHRMVVLDKVRSCLNPKDARPVICISTQLIEAGVDVDFGSVIRSVAGLDSIAQAAGRCNRNGRRPSGNVYVINPDFESIDRLTDIRIGKEKAERLLDEYHKNPDLFDHDLLGPKAIGRYFEYYFHDRAAEMKYPVGSNSIIGRDDNLLSLLSTNSITVEDFKRVHHSAPQIYFRQSFMTAAKVFQAIDSPTQGIIVPYKDGRRIIAELCAVYNIDQQYGLLREAQRYSVNVFPNEWRKLTDQHAIFEIQKNAGIYYLYEAYYDPDLGLTTTPGKRSSIQIA